MYPTRTTSTTGTFRIPPAPPQAPAVRTTGEAPTLHLHPSPQAAQPAPEPRSSAEAAAGPLPQAAQWAPEAEPIVAAAVIPAPYAARPEPEAGPWAEARPGPEADLPAEVGSKSGLSYGAQSGSVPASLAGAADQLPQPGSEAAPPATATPGAYPARPGAEPEAGAVIPAPSEAPADAAAAMDRLAHAAQAGSEFDAPVGAAAPAAGSGSELEADRALGAVAAAVPGGDAADKGGPAWVAGVPVRMVAGPGGVALPHGRPAADSAVSEVPAARIRVEPEPVHALAGAGERAGYGQEPDPLVSVPGPAAHGGVSALRLRGFGGPAEPPPEHAPVWPPAGPGAEPLPGHPAERYGTSTAPHAGPGPAAQPLPDGSGVAPGPAVQAGPRAAHAQLWPPAGLEAQPLPDGSGVAPGPAVQAGPRAADAQLWPPAGPGAEPLPGHPADALPPGGPGADGSAAAQGAPWPLGVPHAEARTAPRPPLGRVWPASGSEAGADRPAQRGGEPWPPAVPQGEAGQPAPRPHAEAESGSRAGHGESGAEPAAQAPYVPQPPAEAGLRVPLGHVWPPARPEAEQGADGAGTRPAEPWPSAGPQGEAGPRVPEPHIAVDAEVGRVPGPAVGDIVALAVARGMAEGETEDPPRVAGAAARGAAVTEVPVHLPFPAESRPVEAPAPAPAREPAPAARPRAPRPAPAPGRRVPRGDERLREHRGPVLPGWVGVGVGGLALTGCLAVLWRAGAVPAAFVAAFGATPRAYQGLRATHWPPLAFLGIVALLALGGLGRAKAGHAWVLTLFGRYRGTVRRTGLTWVSPLLLRRRVDVRLRHWRSEPMPAVDSGGLALRVVVQVVWQVKDTARATLAVEDHTEFLAEQVESAMARVLSQLPADAFHEDAPTLRDSEAVGDALTRMLATETEAVGIEVYSAQPTRIEYAPEVAEAMRRRRVAAIDAKHRDTVLTSVVDAVDDTVHRLTSRGLVELDDYERKALVKDLTVAFYTGRPE
ncbi:SPFH domain-containing protein [Streptomyces sp. NRRL S-244]|uniref:SPFH domain-containing protein n=1 Tax=Streptomyces sp. NRRL S-244 TaxID=1463897 RepID=UPI001EFF0649|nr:SPFH domain-containing protein [Streptomyces sp. NRRL S-244]